MKDHFIVRISDNLNSGLHLHAPYWKNFILDKSLSVESFYPDFDKIFQDHHLNFWLTHEYIPAASEWNNHERQSALNRIYRIILQQDYNYPDSLLDQVKLLPQVESARDVEIIESELPVIHISTQASLSVQKISDLIYLPYARVMTRGNPDIKIAVLDTGINLSHKELQGKIVKRADFVNLEGLDTTDFIGDIKDYDDVPEDEVGHGTHVSGIIAGKGVEMDEGVCPGCGLMAVRVLATMRNGNKKVGAGIPDNINNGIKWAVDNGADIINMSLGMKFTGGGLPHEEVIKYALSKNVTIVAASGNDGTNEKYYPGALDGVIAVGAVNSMGEVTNFTSYGANISVVAPGLNIYSSYADNGYAFASGTSQASPFVAGSIGLFKSYALEQGKNLTNNDIRFILKNTSDKIDSRLRNQRAGYGLINLADAFKLLNYIIN